MNKHSAGYTRRSIDGIQARTAPCHIVSLCEVCLQNYSCYEARLGEYAPGLRPRPSTPGYPSGTKHTCASALTRDRKTGHMRLTTLPACSLDQEHPGTHRAQRSSALCSCYEARLQNTKGLQAWHFFEMRQGSSSPFRSGCDSSTWHCTSSGQQRRFASRLRWSCGLSSRLGRLGRCRIFL